MSGMKAIRYYRYGSPDVLRLEDVDPPAVGDQDVLVRVLAASVNPLDWHFMRGEPYLLRPQAGLRRPKDPGLGADLAGRVEAVGPGVTRFTVGDEVFGTAGGGTLAEYAVAAQDAALALKPANLTFEQAAAAPVAGVTALQALRDEGHLQAGQRVLVNGAAGGVGTFTVQLARAMGAEVTGVCGPAHTGLVASLGAGEVIDYTRDDFTQAEGRYDLVVDIAGSRPLQATRQVLTPHGILVGIGGPNKGRVLGPMTRALAAPVISARASQTLTFFMSDTSAADLAALREYLADGTVTPVIDRTYPLADTATAIRYLEEGHAGGKVIVTM